MDSRRKLTLEMEAVEIPEELINKSSEWLN